MDETHRPSYVYCGDPDTCCGHSEVVSIVCRVCRQEWPCPTKRSHRAPGQIARIERWVEDRIGRPPIKPGDEIDYARFPYHLAIKYKARELARDAGMSFASLDVGMRNWYLGEASRQLYPRPVEIEPRRHGSNVP